MLIPAPPLLIGTAVWFAAGIVASITPGFEPLWQWGGVFLASVAIIDALWIWWEAPPAAERKVQATLPLGVSATVDILLGWRERTPRLCQVSDTLPAGFESEDLPGTAELNEAGTAWIKYRLKPLRRGPHTFGPILLRVRSAMHCWWKSQAVEQADQVRVYPNFSVYSRHALLATRSAALQSGLLKRRRRGEGMEFDQLREYREGDVPRQIDWKATSRFGKLISREYQDERDQRILLLVDCGRRMSARDDALSHFDHSLNALLLLAYVSLRHGDAVGLMTLGGVARLVPPQKSPSTLPHILHAVYDLEPTLEASDFEQAAEILLKREKKRALVVILTNLRDEDDQSLLGAARLLAQRHLVLVASLREVALDQTCRTPVNNPEAAALRDIAVDYRARRDRQLQRLRQAGVMCIDVAPHELAVETVNRYLAIKAGGSL